MDKLRTRNQDRYTDIQIERQTGQAFNIDMQLSKKEEREFMLILLMNQLLSHQGIRKLWGELSSEFF